MCERGDSCRITLTLTPQKRGCIVLDDMRVLLPAARRMAAVRLMAGRGES
jgi:hypothetical protein